MNSDLEKWFNRLETDRRELCKSVSGISHAQFVRRPAPGKWSISEIISHLLSADQLSLEYMKKKSQAIESLRNAGWFEEFKMLVFIASQRLPIKYRAPATAALRSPAEIDLSRVRSDWESLLNDYRQFLSAIPERYIRKKIYKHPILGRLDARLCLQSIYEHYHHHLPQIKRLL